MKQLKEFENWTSDIIKSVLNEKQDAEGKRAIERSRDITYQAKQLYPEYSEEQAVALYVADKLADSERRDYEQNKLINNQRRENEKLRSNLVDIKKEIQSIEDIGKETDQEISRLKQLSGQLQTDIKQRQLSNKEIDDALSQVEQLKNKPGISADQYADIKKQVETFKKEKVNPEEFSKFKDELQAISGQNEVEKQQIDYLRSLIDATQQASAENLKQREAAIVQQQKKLNTELEKIKDSNKDIQKYRRAVSARSKQASTKVNALVGKKTDIDGIKKLGNSLHQLSYETDPDNTNIPSIVNLKRGLERVFNMQVDQGNKIDQLLGISTSDSDDLEKITTTSIQKKSTPTLIGRNSPDEEIDDMGPTMKNTDNLKENANPNNKVTEDLLDKLTDYFTKSWNEDRSIANIFAKYKPEVVSMAIKENFREMIESYGPSYFKNNVNGIILKLIINDLDFFDKKSQYYVYKPRNTSRNFMEEYSHRLDNIMGDQITKWIKK